MVTAGGNPLDRALLLDLGEQACIDGLASRKVALLSMDGVVVHHLHVLL